MRKAKFVITYHPHRGYRWKFKAANGKTVAYGTRLFPDRHVCFKAAERVRDGMLGAWFEYIGHPNEL